VIAFNTFKRNIHIYNCTHAYTLSLSLQELLWRQSEVNALRLVNMISAMAWHLGAHHIRRKTM
jgi:hypothetical protein